MTFQKVSCSQRLQSREFDGETLTRTAIKVEISTVPRKDSEIRKLKALFGKKFSVGLKFKE